MKNLIVIVIVALFATTSVFAQTSKIKRGYEMNWSTKVLLTNDKGSIDTAILLSGPSLREYVRIFVKSNNSKFYGFSKEEAQMKITGTIDYNCNDQLIVHAFVLENGNILVATNRDKENVEYDPEDYHCHISAVYLKAENNFVSKSKKI